MSWLWSPKSMSVHLLMAKERDALIPADIGYEQISAPQSAGGIRVLVQRLWDATAIQTLQQ